MKKFFYRAKKSDSVISVSKKFGVPTFCLIEDNSLTCEIQEGDILLIIKREKTYVVKANETLETVAEKLDVSPEKLSFINGKISYVFYGLILTY